MCMRDHVSEEKKTERWLSKRPGQKTERKKEKERKKERKKERERKASRLKKKKN